MFCIGSAVAPTYRSPERQPARWTQSLYAGFVGGPRAGTAWRWVPGYNGWRSP